MKKQEQFSPVAAQTTDNMPQQELSPAKPTAQIKQTTPVKQVCEEKENSIQTAATNAAEAKQKQKGNRLTCTFSLFLPFKTPDSEKLFFC